MSDLTVVVPRTDTEESGVLPENGTGRVEVLEKVGGNLEIVLEVRNNGSFDLENDNLLVKLGEEHLIQEPAEVAC